MDNPSVGLASLGPIEPTEDIAVEPWGSTLLLVEDNAEDARRIRGMLRALTADHFYVTHVESIVAAQDALNGQDFSVVLLDLSLPDGHGLAAIERLVQAAPQVPVVALGDLPEQNLALQAVEVGAQDFLMKRHVTSRSLTQSLRYAIEHKRAESRLARLAQFDQLTGLANRTLFRQRLEQALIRAEVASEHVALLYVELGRLEEIRRELGRDSAERILQTVADRCKNCVRETETVARIGTREFCIILGGIRDVKDAKMVAERVLESLHAPIDDEAVDLGTFIGVALANQPGEIEALLERADHVVRRAKETGGGPVSLCRAHEAEQQPMTRVAEAFALGEFKLVYQPRINLDDGTISVVEAFLRWEDPERGLLRPVDFMEQLHDAELLRTVNDWVLAEAAAHTVQWRQDSLRPLRMAVNIAASQFAVPDMVERLADVVRKAGAEPSWFELDITESLLMENPARSRMLLKALQAEGFRTAIDDFGTGFGHLAELARLPLDVIKIDRSIVDGLDEYPARRALVAAAVALGRELALEVVAEGVEHDGEVQILRSMGATTVQGYWLAEPKSAPAFTTWWQGRQEPE